MVKDLVLATAPTEDLLDLDAAKQHLGVLFDDDDDLIQAYLEAVGQHLDGYAGVLGRALVTQTWRLSLRAFPRCRRLELPLPPLVSVGSIAYVDANGTTQTVSASDYTVLAGAAAAVELAYNAVWPVARCQARAVTVTFTAGYGAAVDVPKPIVVAAKMLLGDLYANREAQFAAGGTFTVLPNTAVERLLSPFKLPRT